MEIKKDVTEYSDNNSSLHKLNCNTRTDLMDDSMNNTVGKS
jgi:hypothetical protein